MGKVLAHPFAAAQSKFGSTSLPITISLLVAVILASRLILKVCLHEMLWQVVAYFDI